jgi:predicted PurR-regulated permease PerM
MANHAATARRTGEASWRGLVAAPLWVLATIALAFFLRETRGFFVPLALGFLASYVLQPVVRRLDRLGTPRVVNAGAVLAVVAGAVGFLAWTLKDDFTQAVRELPQQVREMRRQVDSSDAGGTLTQLQLAAREMQGSATGQEATTGQPPAGAQQPAPQPSGPQVATGTSATARLTGPLAEYLWQGSFGLMTAAGQITVIVFFVFFLLTAAEQWRIRLVNIAGSTLSTRRTATEVLDEINWQIQRFLLVRLITSVLVAVATWGVLLFFGAPAPGLWAVAAGVFNWVPYFGPIIVSAGLGIVGFVSGGLTVALQLAGAALVITSLEGWLITPPLLGRAARMSTLAVFVSLLFWSWVWGIWGTILAVPLTSMIKAVSDHVEPLGWLSRLLSQDPDDARAT